MLGAYHVNFIVHIFGNVITQHRYAIRISTASANVRSKQMIRENIHLITLSGVNGFLRVDPNGRKQYHFSSACYTAQCLSEVFV